MFSYRHAFHAGNHADVLKHTVLIATLLWVGAITFLHAALNWGLFEPAPAYREARAKFKVGYLPVT